MITTPTHLFFYGARPFNNWVRTPRQIREPFTGLTFDSSEQYFMFLKAKHFLDHITADLILAEKDPKAAKELGRQVKGYVEEVWAKVREGAMTHACYLKFSQNPEWGKILLGTGDRTIVEASPIDTIWGVGLAEKDPLILDEKNWKGLNLLGKSLVKVREMLRKEANLAEELARHGTKGF
jgi:hypothetical protein